MTLTYDQALANFRNEVNRKFPPDVGGSNRSRRISQTKQGRGRVRNGRGRGSRFTQGGRYSRQGGRGGRSGRDVKRQLQDSSYITLTDGTPLEYHPSFRFTDDVYRKFKDTDKAMLQQQRAEYKELRSRQSSQVSYASHYPQGQSYVPPYVAPHPLQISQMSQGQPYLPPYPPHITLPQIMPPPPPHASGTSQISQITQDPQQQQPQSGTMFGGGNEQTTQRRRT